VKSLATRKARQLLIFVVFESVIQEWKKKNQDLGSWIKKDPLSATVPVSPGSASRKMS
jgi:hypothetical protein